MESNQRSRKARPPGWVARPVFLTVWAGERVHIAMSALCAIIAGLAWACAEMAAPDTAYRAAWAVLAGACVLALLAWIRFLAVPYARNKLAKRRVRQETGLDPRQKLRTWRASPRYQPHAHARPKAAQSVSANAPPSSDC